jgi:putative transposase
VTGPPELNHLATLHVSRMCQLLGVSASGFYAWLHRKPSVRARKDAALSGRIQPIQTKSMRTHARPRIHAQMRSEGTVVCVRRVRWLMLASGLAGALRRRGWRTTLRGGERAGIPDLVGRNSRVMELNQVWVADTTYVPTWKGFVVLAGVVDAFSRRGEGWLVPNQLWMHLVLDARDIVIGQRC